MSTSRPDLSTKVFPEPLDHHVDYFDQLPDSLLLLVFNKIGDVKSLGRCCVVSKRFHCLVPQVENVVVRVDCVISDDDDSSSAITSSSASGSLKSRLRFLFSSLLKPLNSLTQFVMNGKRSCRSSWSEQNSDQDDVTHHSPAQVLKNFNEIKFLRVELPSGEFGIEDSVLLKWRANFGSMLDSCVILGAASVTHYPKEFSYCENISNQNGNFGDGGDNGSIPESFYTNGGLKLRVAWTISSLIAASARHYLLQPIIAKHQTLDNLVLTDADGQGVLCMNKEQLKELRGKPLSASSASKRTMVPALSMRLWYSPHLDLPDGTVLKGATLVAIRPSELPKKDVVASDVNWITSAFEEPFATAARMLVKRRTYCLEMNSF